MNAPTVTVAIPFFNSESTIAYAIESVLAQEFTDFELLLVNDGSTDGGVKAVRRYLDGQRVRLVDDCSNLGLAPRLNQIAALARGRYLARMDADDIMHPARLRRQVEYLDAHPDVDLVGTGAYFIDTDYSIIERRITRHVRLCRKFSYLQLFHPTVTGRLEWFRDNPYSGQFLRCEDMELWLRVGGGPNIASIDDPLLYYSRFTTLDAIKTLMSLRQYREILQLLTHLTCTACRLREVTVTRMKEVVYRTLATVGLLRQVVRFASSSSKSEVESGAELLLQSILARATKSAQAHTRSMPEGATPSNSVQVGIKRNADRGLHYPESEFFFSPDEHYPEYPFAHLSPKPNQVYRMVRDLFREMRLDLPRYGTADWNPLGEWIRRGQTVFTLVNFVTERRPMQSRDAFDAMLTHPSVIRVVLDYIIIATGDASLVTFGNAPVQSARMDKLTEQNGAICLRKFYLRHAGCEVGPRDLRLYISRVTSLGAKESARVLDPRDEVTFDLGTSSSLDALPEKAFSDFRVEDYGSDATNIFHRKGSHLYKLHRDVVDSDVIFHVAKLKTHGKVAVTGALKGAVGAVSRKECLAHHRHGSAQLGNDEFRRSTLLTRLYAALGNRATVDCPNSVRILHKTLGRILDLVLKVDISGSWHGNDTAWRMALDINKCLIYGQRDGSISTTPVRKICCLLEGIVSGEGDGPIHVRSRKDGVLVLSSEPCFADLGAALLMGFDPSLIPLIREAFLAQDFPLSSAPAAAAEFLLNGSPVTADDIPGKVIPLFRPPRGWIGHIECLASHRTNPQRNLVESSVGTVSAGD